MDSRYAAPPIPSAFIWRKAHSLTGLWLVLFLIEHLLTNSQAALFFGDDGNGFVKAVNGLKNLPYLPLIEIFLLGVPFLVHALWGIHYLFTAKYNVLTTDGSSPSLGQYGGNQAYTWQRITSWILLFGIIAHVVQMRFIDYPTIADKGLNQDYMLVVSEDKGLYSLAPRLGFALYDQKQMEEWKSSLSAKSLESAHSADEKQKLNEIESQLGALKKLTVKDNERLIVAPNFGLAELMMVRDTFKNPVMIFLYTGLVLAACFHAFNGLWTFLISWGVTLTARSQAATRKFATVLMVLISFLGLAAIWGTYWINLFD